MDKIIRFPSEMENVALAENLVDEVSEAFSISPDIYGNILVSLVEAVNNAIRHGNKLNSDKDVMVGYTKKTNSILFLVKDDGEGFEPNEIPDPTTQENIEKPNGRGVFLMRNLADMVEFLNNGTEVRLTFKLD